MIGERYCEVRALDWIGLGKRERDWGLGLGIDDGVDCERTGIKGEGAGVRVLQRDERRAMDGGRWEIEVEGKRDVSCEWVC